MTRTKQGGRITLRDLDRFRRKVRKDFAGCWVWTASVSGTGYGQFFHRGTMRGAHRVAWEISFGPIPDGQFVCHTCDNPRCVRPSHLFLGTPALNSADMVRKGRTRTPGAPGSANGHAKLTERQVRDALVSPLSAGEVARAYGVDRSTITSIRRGVTWKDVTRGVHATV